MVRKQLNENLDISRTRAAKQKEQRQLLEGDKEPENSTGGTIYVSKITSEAEKAGWQNSIQAKPCAIT